MHRIANQLQYGRACFELKFQADTETHSQTKCAEIFLVIFFSARVVRAVSAAVSVCVSVVSVWHCLPSGVFCGVTLSERKGVFCRRWHPDVKPKRMQYNLEKMKFVCRRTAMAQVQLNHHHRRCIRVKQRRQRGGGSSSSTAAASKCSVCTVHYQSENIMMSFFFLFLFHSTIRSDDADRAFSWQHFVCCDTSDDDGKRKGRS